MYCQWLFTKWKAVSQIVDGRNRLCMLHAFKSCLRCHSAQLRKLLIRRKARTSEHENTIGMLFTLICCHICVATLNFRATTNDLRRRNERSFYFLAASQGNRTMSSFAIYFIVAIEASWHRAATIWFYCRSFHVKCSPAASTRLSVCSRCRSYQYLLPLRGFI